MSLWWHIMYKIIENDSFFDDIKSQEARDNFDRLVDYLCSSLVPNGNIRSIDNRIILEDEILIDGDYNSVHSFFANDFYSSQNLKLVNEILQNRTTYNKIDCCDPYLIDGYSDIYELDKEKILKLGTMRFYYSVAVMEHELIHILMAINNNNPQPQHTEILSIFVELLSLISFSKRYNNPNIYENALVNKCVHRMSHRVKASQFSDECIKENGNFIYQFQRNSYPYMLGLIYASRLLNIYRNDKENVLSKINDELSGKSSVEELLNDYNISLTDNNTCRDFIHLCDEYRNIVENRYSPSELHRVK